MKKLILLFVTMLAAGSLFQACEDTKTYAEMLEEEKDGINAYIKRFNIKVISESEFERNDSTTNVAQNEYVAFANGVYMQIVDKGSMDEADKFKTNNLILARFVEVDILQDDTTYASNVCNPIEILNVYPDGFRYTDNGVSIYGQFISEAGLGFNMMREYGSSVPSGWLIPLQYVRKGAHVKLIIPSKMGHQTAQQEVWPYFYDIREFSIY